MALKRIKEHMIDKEFTEKVNNHTEQLNDVSTQLAQTQEELLQKATTEKVNEIEIIKADKTQIWSMANMGQDIKEAMTGGSVAVFGENTVLADNIVDGQVFGRKTDFLKVDENRNLLDKRKVVANYIVDGGNDGNLKPTNGFYASDFIEVTPGLQCYHRDIYVGYYAFYDKDKNYVLGSGIAGSGNNLSNPFIVPENCFFLRVTLTDEQQLVNSWISTKNIVPEEFRYKFLGIVFNDEQEKKIIELSQENIIVSPERTNFLEPIGNVNLIDKQKLIKDTYIRGDRSGQEGSFTDYYATPFILMQPNIDYWFSNIFTGYYAFYDENKEFISGGGNASETRLTNPFSIPENAVYGRFSLSPYVDRDKCWINTKNEQPPDIQHYKFKDNIELERTSDNPCLYKGEEITIFNKILCIGDSLTQGVFNITNHPDKNYHTDESYSFPSYLQKMTGVEVTNAGISGYDSKEWYEHYQNEDLSGHDCAIIQLGVNDVYHGLQDETTTYLTNIIEKIKAENEGIKIFVSTIVPAYSSTNFDDMSHVIRNFVDGRSDCYLTDIREYSRTKKGTVYEQGHLTAYGYYALAKDYKGYISYIIANNQDDFKFIHFIGTEYK